MNRQRYLKTAEIAKRVGVHPNTVRLYEVWGFLPPVSRSAGGYRQFTETHLDQMQFARTALHGGWPGRKIRESALTLVRQAASGNLRGALEHAHHHLQLVQAERAQAEAAAEYLTRWVSGAAAVGTATGLRIGQAAELLDLTIDTLRSWERNSLVKAPRDSVTGYRLYGAAEIGRLRVIRMLLRSGYSTMAILRMLLQLDQGHSGDLRQALDTPRPDEDVYYAADRWLSTLSEHEQRASQMIAQLEEMTRKRQASPETLH